MTHDKTIGTRAEVFHGTAKHTSGGLEKKDLLKNKHGRIVSKNKHSSAKKEKRLIKAGYGTKKGKFGFVKLTGGRKHKSAKGVMMGRAGGSRKRRGGNVNLPLSPSDVSNYGWKGTTAENPSTSVQFAAGMGN